MIEPTDPLLSTHMPLTERVESLATLRMYAQVLESMVEGVSLSDEEGIIQYTNPAEDRIFGYERGELTGQHVSVQNTYTPEENMRIVNTVIEELQARGYWEGEFSNRKKDGTAFITFARITAIEADGKRYFVCVQEDVTERRRAEADLKDSRNQLEAILSNIADGITVQEPTGRLVYANAEAARLIGFS